MLVHEETEQEDYGEWDVSPNTGQPVYIRDLPIVERRTGSRRRCAVDGERGALFLSVEKQKGRISSDGVRRSACARPKSGRLCHQI